MFTNFTNLHRAYGFDNPLKSREHLSYEEELRFVNDCFDTYEYIGFAKIFATPYTEKKQYEGMKFTVLNRVKDDIELECLPMWNILFENGDIIMAFPEEICLAERKQRK